MKFGISDVREEPVKNFVDLPAGGRLFVDLEDARGRALLESNGNFNPSSVRLWNLILQLHNWPTVIDVGANYGEMIATASIPEFAQVFAFEPNPRILPFLKKTLSTLESRVSVLEVAVSDCAKASVDFVLDLRWSGTSKLSDLKSGRMKDLSQIISVPCTSIDVALLGKLRTGFAMKIDVEGNEMAVLKGASQSLNVAVQWAVMLEILHMSIRDIRKLARHHKLFLYRVDENTLVRVSVLNYLKLRRLLLNPSIYRQDAVIMSSTRIYHPIKCDR
jgi:FkbM family methyltransferase